MLDIGGNIRIKEVDRIHIMPGQYDSIPQTRRAHPAAGDRPARRVTETFFFPAAAFYATFAVPVSVHGMFGGPFTPPGLATPTGHAHEMFFGYTLAVLTGFLVNRLETPKLIGLAGLWIVARVTFLTAPGSLLALAANAAFAIAVAVTAAPRFMKAAKKWRNRVIGPLVIAICTAALAFHLAGHSDGTATRYAVLGIAVVLFAGLMLFFGGRLIAPAAAGAIEKAGGELKARVQPRIEGTLLILMGAAVMFTSWSGLRPVAGAILVGAGVLALVRLARWRLWRCRERIDLLCLGTGYAWLGFGLVLLGLGWSAGIGPGTAATHAITIGALGTLTTSVMARSRLLRIRIAPAARAPWLVTMTVAMAAAALIRIFAPYGAASFTIAAATWALATGTLLGLLLRDR